MKRGFTLVELLAVVAILAVIATVAGISYTSITNKQKTDACNDLKRQLETSAIEYVQDNDILRTALPADSNCGCPNNSYCKCVPYSKLVSEEYMESDLKNPKTDASLETVYIKVQRGNDLNYSAEVTSGLSC